MDARILIAPKIEDPEALQDFVEQYYDHSPSVERDIARLRDGPPDRDVVANLFRTVHSLKGDAGLCKIELAVAVLHPIETVLARLREGSITMTPLLAEAVLLAFDRLELALEGLVDHRSVDGLRLLPLVQGLEKVGLAEVAEIEDRAADLIEAVTDLRPGPKASTPPLRTHVSKAKERGGEIEADLQFFRTLALQLEHRSPLFRGRTNRILRLAHETNRVAGAPVDAVQLEAAVYLHDLGMMLLPESVWLKVGRLSEEERQALKAHPDYAAGLIERMPGWEDAAEMVRQHHEKPDGSGYPLGLTGESIAAGAKILAIVDAFEAVMLKHKERGRNRSVLRAIAEINACDDQFAAEWTAPFNQVIRRSVEGP